MAYTVDEVSDALGVPRPTLYRYLREYSVPHGRRAGKIYVPEESFDRIKEIRELHREGLDTESVRRRLREGAGGDAGGLGERLDRISETLESLGGDPRTGLSGASTTQALHTVLARQTVLISAVFNLTEMLEELLAVHGVRRVATPGDAGVSSKASLSGEAEVDSDATPRNGVATNGFATRTPPGPVAVPRSTKSTTKRVRQRKFGALSRRRQHVALVLLLALLAAGAFLYGGAFGTSPEESSEPVQEEVPASSAETGAENSGAPPSTSADQDAQESNSNVADSNGVPGWEQPAYPVQDIAPGPTYQEPPLQQQIAPEPVYPGQPVPQAGGAGPAPAGFS